MSSGIFSRLARRWWLMLVVGVIIGLAVGLPLGRVTLFSPANSNRLTGTASNMVPPANSAEKAVIYRAFNRSYSEVIEYNPLLSEIKLFPYVWQVSRFKICNGDILPNSFNYQLSVLLGATFGGDGKTTFAIPNLTQKSPLDGLTYQISTDGSWPGSGGPVSNELQHSPGSKYENPSLGEILLAKNIDEQACRWMKLCDGRLLKINENYENQALFSLLGCNFGGDWKITFALPNMTEVKSPVEGAKYYIVTQGQFPHRD